MTATATSVRQTFAWMRDVLRDIRTLLKTLDEELAGQGWLSINDDFEPGMSVESGATFYRGHMQGTGRKAPRNEFRGVEVHLLPDFADEAMLLLFVVEMSEPTTPKDFWDQWSDIGDVLGLRAVNEASVTMGQDPALPIKGATRLVVEALPLAQLANRRAVKEVLVPRLLGIQVEAPPGTPAGASPAP